MDDTSPGLEIQILAGPQALAEYAAGHFIQIARDSIEKRDSFRVALAGGSTPCLLYEYLSQPVMLPRVEWASVQVYWGDERCVPPEHSDSNYLMARRGLLDHTPLPAGNIHRIFGELGPDIAASSYASELQSEFPGQQLPCFDLILLGLGEAGHTASLFPGSLALLETDRWVVAVEHTVFPPPLVSRISLTLPAINNAANVLFLVSGAGKADIFGRVMDNSRQTSLLPARLVNPSNGHLVWAIDRLASGDYLKNADLD